MVPAGCIAAIVRFIAPSRSHIYRTRKLTNKFNADSQVLLGNETQELLIHYSQWIDFLNHFSCEKSVNFTKSQHPLRKLLHSFKGSYVGIFYQIVSKIKVERNGRKCNVFLD